MIQKAKQLNQQIKYLNAETIWKYIATTAVFILSFSHLLAVVLNHYYFKTYGYDYSVYNFSFYDYAHLRNSAVPIYHADYPIKFMQDHFSLSLIFLSPLYWIFSPLFGTYSLLIIQFCLIMCGGYATFKLISEKFGNSGWGLAAWVLYLSIYSRYSSYQNDCNLAILGSAMVPVFVLFFCRKKYILALFILLFLIFNREDFPLGTFFLAFYLFLISKDRDAKIWASCFAVLSLILFIINFSVIIPMLEDEHKKFSLFNFSALGNSPLQAFKFMFAQPIDFAKLFVRDLNGNISHEKLAYYLLFLGSGGIFLFLRPLSFIPLVPLLFKKMLNDDLVRNGVESYHGVEIASLLPYLVFTSIYQIKLSRLRLALAHLVIVLNSFTAVSYFMSSTDDRADFNKFNPFAKSFYGTDGFETSHLYYMLDQIPNDASVCASGRISTHLTFRDRPTYFNKITDITYLCIFRNNDFFPYSENDYRRIINEILVSGDWQILLADEKLMLLKRKR